MPHFAHQYLKTELQAQFQNNPMLLEFLDEGSLDGIWYWDLENMDNTWVSKRFVEMLGYTQKDVPSADDWWRAHIHPDDLPAVYANFEAHMADPSLPYAQTVRYLHRDGSILWVRARGIIFRDDAGKPTRMLGVHTDITALKRREAELQAREDELQLIFDNVPVRLWLKDDQNRILRLNAPAAASMGIDRAQAEGANTSDLFPEMELKYYEDYLRVVESGQPERGIVEIYTLRDTPRAIVRTDKIPFTDAASGRRQVLVASVDITREHEAEAAAEHANNLLRSKNVALRQFASSVSHDLRAPLRHIGLFAELTREAIEGKDPQKALDCCDHIVASADRLQDMVSAVLRFAESANADFESQTVDLEQTFSAAMAALGSDIKASQASITIGQTGQVLGEPKLLVQVFQNLLENAIKYAASDRPEIHISCTAQANGELEIQVADNGIGIDPAHAENVFEPFQQIRDQKTRANTKGVGLGLALCNQIVAAHGGSICVKPNLPQGSIFCVRLPCPSEA